MASTVFTSFNGDELTDLAELMARPEWDGGSWTNGRIEVVPHQKLTTSSTEKWVRFESANVQGPKIYSSLQSTILNGNQREVEVSWLWNIPNDFTHLNEFYTLYCGFPQKIGVKFIQEGGELRLLVLAQNVLTSSTSWIGSQEPVVGNFPVPLTADTLKYFTVRLRGNSTTTSLDGKLDIFVNNELFWSGEDIMWRSGTQQSTLATKIHSIWETQPNTSHQFIKNVVYRNGWTGTPGDLPGFWKVNPATGNVEPATAAEFKLEDSDPPVLDVAKTVLNTAFTQPERSRTNLSQTTVASAFTQPERSRTNIAQTDVVTSITQPERSKSNLTRVFLAAARSATIDEILGNDPPQPPTQGRHLVTPFLLF